MLLDLIDGESIDFDTIQAELSKHPWDIEEPLVTLELQNIVNKLHQFVDGKLSSEDIAKWAELIESREDIEFATQDEIAIKQLIFELANPEINYPINSKRANEIIKASWLSLASHASPKSFTQY